MGSKSELANQGIHVSYGSVSRHLNVVALRLFGAIRGNRLTSQSVFLQVMAYNDTVDGLVFGGFNTWQPRPARRRNMPMFVSLLRRLLKRLSRQWRAINRGYNSCNYWPGEGSATVEQPDNQLRTFFDNRKVGNVIWKWLHYFENAKSISLLAICFPAT